MVTKNIEQESLVDALAYARVTELPPVLQEAHKRSWIRAIARVRKGGNDINYCIVKRGLDDAPVVIADWGNMGIIKDYISIHPYKLIDEQRVREFGNVEDARRILKGFYDESEWGKLDMLSDEKVEALVMRIASEQQLELDAHQEKIKEVEEASRAKFKSEEELIAEGLLEKGSAPVSKVEEKAKKPTSRKARKPKTI